MLAFNKDDDVNLDVNLFKGNKVELKYSRRFVWYIPSGMTGKNDWIIISMIMLMILSCQHENWSKNESKRLSVE